MGNAQVTAFRCRMFCAKEPFCWRSVKAHKYLSRQVGWLPVRVLRRLLGLWSYFNDLGN